MITYPTLTLDAKSLFKYFPKKSTEESTRFCFDTRKRTLYTLVVKEETEFEDCPMRHQLLEVLKANLGDEYDETNEYLLLDQFLIMDFGDIFMPIPEDASSSMRSWKEGLRGNVQHIVENGFDMRFDDYTVHMMPFDKSGNMSRNSRISFVNEKYMEQLNERLNLGMDFSDIQVKLSKYYAYRGLYLSTSQRVEHQEFRITPETLVIVKGKRLKKNSIDPTRRDYEKDVLLESATEGNLPGEWMFEEPHKKDKEYVDEPYDGEGLIDPAYAKYINEALGVEDATSFQIRLPFAKGMLHQVDVLGFIDEFTEVGKGSQQYIYEDAFGIERDLTKAHIFLTESMLKGYDWLKEHCEKNQIQDPMQYYCEMIEKFHHGLYVSGTNLPYGHSKYTHLSYQAINTLTFEADEFERIIKGHGHFIENPIDFTTGYREIEKSDVANEDGDIDARIETWKCAVMDNPAFAGDKYIQQQLENVQKSLLTKMATGKILVEGQTRYLCRDLVPLLADLLREDADINDFFLRCLYTRFYLPCGKGKSPSDLLDFKKYYAFFRSPHLSRNEQFMMRAFVLPGPGVKYAKDGAKEYDKYIQYVKMYDRYFGHLTGVVMIPRGSTLPLCLGGADFDGDLTSIIFNQDVVHAVLRGVYEWQPSNSLYWYKRNLPAIKIPSTSASKEVVPETVPYKHLEDTFSNYIGQISNAAISIGQLQYARNTSIEMEFDATKPTCDKCTILTGLEIDAAKNGVHPNLDLILKTNIPKAPYLNFLKAFKELKSEENFDYKEIQISKEIKEIDGVEQETGVIEITAKDCDTVIKWDTTLEKEGTYINLLPHYFLKYLDVYKGAKLKSKRPKIKQKEKSSKDEKVNIEAFVDSCEEIFQLYKFYKRFLSTLTKEKNKGYHAVENSELHIMRMYDEDQVDKQLFETLQGIKAKIAASITEPSQMQEIRERINTEQWQFQPRERRGYVLERIIGNGFRETELTDEERELLYCFRQQGYKLLWRVLDLIEGPRVESYEDLFAQECANTKEIMVKEFENLDTILYQDLMRYYENNTANAAQQLYVHTLQELNKLIGIYANTGVDRTKLAAALYKKSESSIDKTKFFWDAFSWDDLRYLFEEKEATETC